MIVLQQLTWDNCFSYGKGNSIDFSKNTITQLLGKNGHGKSSIALILQEVLYSKNTKGIKKADILNRDIQDNYYSIELDLEVNKIPYKITQRRTSSKVEVTLLRAGVDISEHTSTGTLKKIEELLGLSFDEFTQLIYQSNNSTFNLLNATDTSRKRFLISLLNLQKYSELESKVKQVLHDVILSRTAISTELDTIKTWLSRLQDNDLVLLDSISVPEDPEHIRAELAELKAIQANELALKKEYNNIKQTNEKIEYLRQKTKDRPEDPEDIESLVSEIATIKALGNSLLTKKKELSSIEGACPTCKRPFEGIDTNILEEEINNLTEAIKLKKSELALLEKRLIAAKSRKQNLDAYNLFLTQLENLEEKELPELNLEGKVEARIAVLESELKAKLNDIKKAQQHNLSVAKHNSKVESTRETKAQYENQLIEVQQALEKVQSQEARLKVLKQVFGASGLVAYKIESLIQDLEDLINHYVEELSQGRFTLSFKMDKDKLDLNLTDNGKKISPTALSAGESARVNTGILLAVRKLLNSLSKNKVNLLIFDDVIGILDNDAREKLVEILSQETELNTFIVSQSWQHPLLARIVVEKNKISTLKED